jgi:predicted HNH restriction endonuclease
LRFGGQRETVLARDGASCRICGAGEAPRRLHVHHRQPGQHAPELLIAVCAACHARIHRLLALRVWLPEGLVELWTEQHPGTPVQLQLALASELS